MTASRDESLATIELEVGALIRRLRPIVARNASLIHEELPGACFLTLSWLNRHGPARASDIACSVGIDKGALSRQLTILIDLKLVDKVPDPNDGRAQLLSVTEFASGRLAEVAGRGSEKLKARLAGWSDEDLMAFAAMFARYNSDLSV